MKYLRVIVVFLWTVLLSIEVSAQGIRRGYQNPGFFIPAKELNRPAEKLPQVSSSYQKPSSSQAVRYIIIDGRFVPVAEKAPAVEVDLIEDDETAEIAQNSESAENTAQELQNVAQAPQNAAQEIPSDTQVLQNNVRTSQNVMQKPQNGSLTVQNVAQMPQNNVQQPRNNSQASQNMPQISRNNVQTFQNNVRQLQNTTRAPQNKNSSKIIKGSVENVQTESAAPTNQAVAAQSVFEVYDDKTDTTRLPPYKTRYNKYFAKLNVFQQSGVFPPDADFDQAMKKFKTRQEIILFQGVPE